jgi:hypothetical protein
MFKKILFILWFSLLSSSIFACHGTTITLISGPTAIGGGQYQTTIQACFAQYTAGNWGGTQNFTFILSGATYVSFSPATITNNYNAYTTATCAGPNCFMGTCLPVSAVATGTLTSSTVVTYNTTSSVPTGFPIVPDDNESCTGCPTSFCFNFTFVSTGYPTAISLSGNIEMVQPKICRSVCGFATNYSGGPCNGSYDADMTITFGALPIELLFFNGYNNSDFVLLEWVSATESNNDYYTIEKSIDGFNWEYLETIDGAGNSSIPLRYTCKDVNPNKGINYYRLKQTDYNGQSEYFQIIAVAHDDSFSKVLIKTTDLLGREVSDSYDGVIIRYYDNGTHDKIYRVKNN